MRTGVTRALGVLSVKNVEVIGAPTVTDKATLAIEKAPEGKFA